MAEVAIAPPIVIGPQLQYDLEQFYYAECALLDDHRFDEWLALFTPDVRYFMPNRVTQMTRDARRSHWGAEGFALFDDDHAALASRIKRLATGQAWAEEPRSRTRRLVSNLRIAPVDDPAQRADHLQTRLNFAIYRSRRESDEDMFFGQRIDRLRRRDGGWAICDRRIEFDQTVLTHHNLSIFF